MVRKKETLTESKFDDLADITIRFEDPDGQLIIDELDRRIISRRQRWITVVFRYRVWSRGKKKWSEPNITIQRYQRFPEKWKLYKDMPFTSETSVKMLMRIITRWCPPTHILDTYYEDMYGDP